MQYVKIRFANPFTGRATAGLVVPFEEMKEKNIAQLSRYFPSWGTPQMKSVDVSPVFSTWESAFLYQFPETPVKPSFTSPLAADLWSMFAQTETPLRPLTRGVVYFHDQATQRALGRRQARATPSDSGVKWALLPRCGDATAHLWAERNGLLPVSVVADFDCSGQYFARSVHVRHCGLGTLVQQAWGYDL